MSTVAVVSGGTSGMGLAVAERFAREGAAVCVLGRGRSSLDAAAESISGAGARDVLALRCDVTDEPSVAEAFEAVGERWGHLNALVNAVGPGAGLGFGDLTDELWRETLDAGLLSAVRTIRHGLPWLRRAPWGRIVNLTAMSVKHQNPNLIAYTASKAALASVTKNLAKSLGAEGILVNAVAPGAVLTPALSEGFKQAGLDGDDPEVAYAVMEAQYNHHADLRRVGLPSELAEVIWFCASEHNTYMTGAHLNVDGGTDFA